MLRALVATLEGRDPCMRGHAERVGAISRQLAALAGLSPDEAEVVGLAGLFHDVGKIARACSREMGDRAPPSLHPAIGAQLVAPFEFLTLAAPMIRHHHERLDGSGYPDGLRGHAIPIGARILAVADEYDRLTAGLAGAVRPRDAALVELAPHAGRTLDSTVVSALFELSLP